MIPHDEGTVNCPTRELGTRADGFVQSPRRKESHRDFERALAETKLPECPDYEAANHFLIKARHGMARLNPL